MAIALTGDQLQTFRTAYELVQRAATQMGQRRERELLGARSQILKALRKKRTEQGLHDIADGLTVIAVCAGIRKKLGLTADTSFFPLSGMKFGCHDAFLFGQYLAFPNQLKERLSGLRLRARKEPLIIDQLLSFSGEVESGVKGWMANN